MASEANIKNGLIVNGGGIFNGKVSGATAVNPLDLVVLGQVVFGSQGFQGAQGFQGFQGSAGSNGSSGSQGPMGFQGNTGNTGLQGPQGNVGSNGSSGSQGPIGFQGSVGSTGNIGFQGNAGSQGSQGSQGFTAPASSLNDVLSNGNISRSDIYVWHIIATSSTNASLTASLGTNVSSATVTGSDTSLEIVLTTSGIVSGTILTGTFQHTYNNLPIMTILPRDFATATASNAVIINATSQTGFIMAGAISMSGTYRYNVLVFG